MSCDESKRFGEASRIPGNGLCFAVYFIILVVIKGSNREEPQLSISSTFELHHEMTNYAEDSSHLGKNLLRIYAWASICLHFPQFLLRLV